MFWIGLIVGVVVGVGVLLLIIKNLGDSVGPRF